MTLRIQTVETSPAARQVTRCEGSGALELDGAILVVLRFVIEASDNEELEALRHARRSMLREESTRGREDEEPSLEDAVFSPAEIAWQVRADQRGWCLQKLQELSSRASRCLADLPSV